MDLYVGLNKPPLVFPQNAALSRPGEYDSAIGCYQEAPVISPGRSWFPKSYIYIYIYIYTIYPDILLTLE